MFWIHHILFTSSPVDGHLGCFHFLAIVNNAAMNIHVYIFMGMYVFISLGYVSSNGFSVSHGKCLMLTMFNCLMN